MSGRYCRFRSFASMQYYDTDYGAFVWKDVARNSPNGGGASCEGGRTTRISSPARLPLAGEFWYQVWMAMLPLQILHGRTPYAAPWPAAPPAPVPPSRLAPFVLNASLNWVAAEAGLGGSASTLPDFNWTGVNFTTGGGPPRGYLDSHAMTQPVAAAGLAWLHYTAAAAGRAGTLACSDAACQASLLQAARWGLDYLTSRVPYDPFWEVLLPHGAATAARMNAELRSSPSATAYNLSLLLGWILQDDATPPHSPFRWGWGTVCDSWGGIDVHGLIGSITDRDGYAFGMDSFAALAGALPVARYNASFARALGKWASNAANAARLFFPAFNAPEQQSNWAWASAPGVRGGAAAAALGYEGEPTRAASAPAALKWLCIYPLRRSSQVGLQRVRREHHRPLRDW